LHGTGFKAGAVVKVDTPAAGASYSPVSHTLVDPTTMTISLALNDATSAGVWSFTVTEGSYTTPPATVTVSVA
jgi:hypothetical protein